MIRPIDTQILYPQSPELSNRQQVSKQQGEIQQQQFADIVHKQNQSKKETVQKSHKDEKVNNNEEKKQENEKQQKKQSKEHSQNKKNQQSARGESCTIDIKV